MLLGWVRGWRCAACCLGAGGCMCGVCCVAWLHVWRVLCGVCCVRGWRCAACCVAWRGCSSGCGAGGVEAVWGWRCAACCRGRGQGRRVRGAGRGRGQGRMRGEGEGDARSGVVGGEAARGDARGRKGGCEGEARQRFAARQEASAVQIRSGHFIRGEGGQGGGRDIGREGG